MTVLGGLCNVHESLATDCFVKENVVKVKFVGVRPYFSC